MRRSYELDGAAAAAATAIALVAGVLVWLCLSAIARPADLTTRLSQARQRADEIDHNLANAQLANLYPAGAVCNLAPPTAAANLRQGLQLAASGAGATVTHLEVTPGAGDEGLAGLTSIAFNIEATGRYDQIVFLLKGLSSKRPQIFVDRADLASQTSSVALKLTGHVYCSTYARL